MHAETLRQPVGFDATGKSHNCQIVALAALTGLPYADCEDAFYALHVQRGLHPNRAKWTGTTFLGDLPKAARRLGVNVQTFTPPRPCTFRTLAARLPRGVTCVVITTGHALAVRHGVAIDQHGVRSAFDHGPFSRSRVRCWYQVGETKND